MCTTGLFTGKTLWILFMTLLLFCCFVFLGLHFDGILSWNVGWNLVPHLKLSPCGFNNSECERLLRTLNTWPDTKPRAAIYILTQSSRKGHLHRGLKSIDANFNNCFKYPVIIFHEKELRPSIPWIKSITKSDLYFQEIEFSIPPYILPMSAWPQSTGCKFSVGYKHMCRFHSKLLYEMPIIQNLEYYWRLDDDSFLLANITYDVFQIMRKHDMQYGYIHMMRDRPSCIQGLWSAAKTHMKKKHIEPTFFNSWPERQIFYNNFEISQVNLWTQEKYKNYVEDIDKNGGIYYYRWGDAPIKTIAVTMFVPGTKVFHFKDISYQHKDFKRRIITNTTVNSTLNAMQCFN